MNLLKTIARYASLLTPSEQQYVEHICERETETLTHNEFEKLKKMKHGIDRKRSFSLDEGQLEEMAKALHEAISTCGGWHSEGGNVYALEGGEMTGDELARWQLVNAAGKVAAIISGRRYVNGVERFDVTITYPSV